MSKTKIFTEDGTSEQVGDLLIENGADTVRLSGSLQVDRTKAGLALALQLKAVSDAMVAALQAERSLPDKLADATITTGPNPFA
jgi:hypothetical protein